jgi:quercetin dioxygenase-like cupin family protein
MSAQPDKSASRFAVYRGADAPAFSEIDVMDYDGVTPELEARFASLAEAGVGEGQTVKLLFSTPGFSLTYAWFKSGFPLPRHSHDADCLYYIVAGSLTLGTETLGPGDGFFVPAQAAYAYVPGPEGVEVLEFRNADHFNIRFLAGSSAFWSKALETVRAERSSWAGQPRPQDLAGAAM